MRRSRATVDPKNGGYLGDVGLALARPHPRGKSRTSGCSVGRGRVTTASGYGAKRRLARSGRSLGLLALLLVVAGCAGAGADGSGGQCNQAAVTSVDPFYCGNIIDQDHNNLISPQEWDDAFNAADTDHDGVVSQTEFEAAGGNWGGGGRGR